MNGTQRVRLSKVIDKMQLENLTPGVDTAGIWLHVPEVNRPALQLAGYFDYFDSDRIQLIGNVENSYLQKKTKEDGVFLFHRDVPPKIYALSIAKTDHK